MSAQTKLKQPRRPQRGKTLPYFKHALVILIILLAALIRFRLLDTPLERDEGEYAYAGQLMLQGIPPYQLAYNMKLPGTYAAYALIMALFGQTPAGIHVGLLLVNAATSVIVYFLAARFFGSLAGLAACASFSFLSVCPSVLGTSGHATHFVILPALGGLLLLLKAIEHPTTWTLFVSGFLVGLAFVMKQPGVFFAIFAVLYFIWAEWRIHSADLRGIAARGSILLLGAAAPFIITCLILRAAGVFDKFWFWTFSYAREYATSRTLTEGMQGLSAMLPEVMGSSFPLWVIAALGLVVTAWDRKASTKAPFLLGLFFFSFLAVCPGLYFREHYFILMLPAVAILVGAAVGLFEEYLDRAAWPAYIPISAVLVVLFYSIRHESAFLFEMDPMTACRSMYGLNPFPESFEIAKYLQDHTSGADRLAVLGSEPQIYFYAKRRSATGYIYAYGLMEEQKYARKMQREMIDEIERARPKYLVLTNVITSWLPRPNSERAIFAWVDSYVKNQYSLDGVVDILSREQTVYRWGDEAAGYMPRSNLNLLIFKRK